MLLATLLALTAAVLHAGWNLAVKQTRHDRFIALWAQFLLGGLVGGVALAATGGLAAARLEVGRAVGPRASALHPAARSRL